MTKKDLDPNNPFNWRLRTEPSIFAKDLYFRAKKDGKSDSQRSAEIAHARRSQGNDPVDLYGIGKTGKTPADKILEYRKFGVYSRAQPVKREPNKHEQ